METLKNHFISNSSYYNSYDDSSYDEYHQKLASIFGSLSAQMKIIHENGLVLPRTTVNTLMSDNIVVDDDNNFRFQTMTRPLNFEEEKRRNILAFAKLIIGTYISLPTGFRDYSYADNGWFSENLASVLDDPNINNSDKKYFVSVFSNNENTYYSDFLAKERQAQELNGGALQKGGKVYVKALPGMSGYGSEETAGESEKQRAVMSHLFYPLILLGGFLIFTTVMFIINFVVK